MELGGLKNLFDPFLWSSDHLLRSKERNKGVWSAQKIYEKCQKNKKKQKKLG
jgi:lysozyme family protein